MPAADYENIASGWVEGIQSLLVITINRSLIENVYDEIVRMN